MDNREAKKPYAPLVTMLREVGLRPTRQRLALAQLLFRPGENRHVNAEALHVEALDKEMRVSLATVYNTLHQFTDAGLLKEVVVEPGRTYFDTNVSDHQHFYFEDDGKLVDIADNALSLRSLPPPPEGTEVSRVDVIVRLRNSVE